METKMFECELCGRLEVHIERVHALFDELWRQTPNGSDPKEMVIRARVAVHEWIANLSQHATYGGRTPEANLCLAQTNGRLYCVIEDNSAGFDLAKSIGDVRYEDISHLPERGMGLLLMQGSAASVSYRSISPGRNRLTLTFAKEDAVTGR